ncbi:hypothetical protein FISHEDRAFT_77807 [Fistulina hepatica ATCC 64428]|nr:hypothetical protein FISHEDRAFT_77807 [Fistulina hepatica ATCC 64428]
MAGFRAKVEILAICMSLYFIFWLVHWNSVSGLHPIRDYYDALSTFSGKFGTSILGGRIDHYKTLEEGWWIPRLPPYEPGDLDNLWNGRYRTTRNALEGQTGEQRALDLLNWVWSGYGEAEERPWEEWVLRLLNSNGGLIILGDSISLQQFELLERTLPTDFYVHRASTEVYCLEPPTYAPSHLRILLSPDSPIANALMNMSDWYIPRERFLRPIVTFIRTDSLFESAEELVLVRDDIVLASANEGWHAGIGDWEICRGIKNFVFMAWRSHVEDATKGYTVKPTNERPEEYWEGRQQSVLVVNTGAHFSPSGLRGVSEVQMLEMYRRMVEVMLPVLSNIPNTLFLYRPTIPGHPSCDLGPSVPAENISELSPLTYERNFGWNLFESFNEIWRTAMMSSSPPHEQNAFLPVYMRSVLRPDVHMLKMDCLHHASPAVPLEWIRWTWKSVRELDGTNLWSQYSIMDQANGANT